MQQSDTLNIKDTAILQQDSVFIPQYINKNPDYIVASGDNNISCRQYIFTVLQDSAFIQKERPTVFTEKTYCPPNMPMQQNTVKQNPDWIFGIFVFILLLSALLIRFGGGLIFSFIQGCFSKNQTAITTKDGDTVHPFSLVPVIFIFLPLISFLIFCGLDYLNIMQYLKGYSLEIDNMLVNPLLLWSGIYVCCIILYFFKILLIKFFSWVFRGMKIANYYIQTQLNFGILSGFCLFLPIISAVYADNFYQTTYLLISLSIVVILYFTRLLRCFFVIISTFKFSHLYLFFYLCTLELLPLIVVIKLLFF